jgi:hypothetical protein
MNEEAMLAANQALSEAHHALLDLVCPYRIGDTFPLDAAQVAALFPAGADRRDGIVPETLTFRVNRLSFDEPLGPMNARDQWRLHGEVQASAHRFGAGDLSLSAAQMTGAKAQRSEVDPVVCAAAVAAYQASLARFNATLTFVPPGRPRMSAPSMDEAPHASD